MHRGAAAIVTEPTAPSAGGPAPPGTRPTVTIKLGRLTLTGWAAGIVLLVILGLIIGLIVYMKPTLGSWPLWVSGAMWIAFVVYWGAAASKAAPTKSSESPESRRFHTRLLIGSFVLLFLPIPGLRWRFLPDATSVTLIGLGVQAAFFALAVWARRNLGRNWSGAITVAHDHQLVRSGPYRVLRHPIYTAMLGMFIGAAVVYGQLHALIAVVVLAGAYARKIRLEEQNLRGEFGSAYDDYRRHTWALVPGLF
jgi:protein-S-isoprenylcysteine O-methyltransferase Ste14